MDYQLTFDDDPVFVKTANAWQRALLRLQPTVTKPHYQRFLEPLKPAKREDNKVYVAVPGEFRRTWVQKNFLSSLEEALSDELGEKVTIELVAEPSPKSTVAVPKVGPTFIPTEPKFSDKFTFDTFVVGKSNRLAFGGAMAVATNPGSQYNPLFVYGGSGFGKTHLLHAVANALLSREEPLTVCYVPAQEFAERFVNALQHGRIEQFRRNIRNADVWLVDDVQFIAGRDKTQEELFHTFNQLQGTGKQIVFTSDRPPRDLYVDDRLRSRFESGLVADIVPPDTETRAAIVKAKADVEKVEISFDVCEFLAMNVPGNIRTLEGALTRLIAEASFAGTPLSVEIAQQVIDSAFPHVANHKPTFDKILEEVSVYYDIPRKDIIGQSRKASIAHARHIAVYLTRTLIGDSWKQMGDRFDGRDHTSMIHGYRKIQKLLGIDLETQTQIRNLERRLHHS